MPPAARKTPAAKTPRAVPAAPPAPTDPVFEPLILTSDDTEEDVDMVELCSIDGRSLMIPARPPAGLALQVLEDFEAYNEGVATIKLLRTLLGEEQYAVLRDYKGLKPSHLKSLSQAVTKLTLGAMDDDDPAGN